MEGVLGYGGFAGRTCVPRATDTRRLVDAVDTAAAVETHDGRAVVVVDVTRRTLEAGDAQTRHDGVIDDAVAVLTRHVRRTVDEHWTQES